MAEWQGLNEHSHKLKSIIDTHYPKHKALIKYLDNEAVFQKPGLNI